MEMDALQAGAQMYNEITCTFDAPFATLNPHPDI